MLLCQSGHAGSPRKRWIMLGLALALAYTNSAWAQTVQNPRRIAEGPAGQLLVTDRLFGSVIAVDRNSLEPDWSFPLPDEGAPFGLATWNQLVFVGNTVTRNVEVYRIRGSQGGVKTLVFQYNLGHTPQGETGSIQNPISIAVARKEQLVFVLDGAEKKIKIYDRKGTFLDAFAPLDEAGVLLSPVSLAVDEARQELLVGDYGDPSGGFRAAKPARILIYGYGGELRFQINGNGTTHWNTTFARVQGMTASDDGRIFAADPLGSRILVLDRLTGALLGELGSEGQEPGQLMLPLDVFLDPKTGDLFVSNNRGARRVEVFRGVGR